MLNQNEAVVPVHVIKSVDDNSQSLGIIDCTPSMKVETIFEKIHFLLKEPENVLEGVEIILEGGGDEINIRPYKGRTLKDIGVFDIIASKFKLNVMMPKDKMPLCAQEVIEEDLWLGASASPTTTKPVIRNKVYFYSEPLPSLTSDDEYGLSIQGNTSINDVTNYVGLVNQAMTCYLNSLLQALYMTPEFRNALYNWEFDGQNESRSIPFQLQKLFLNLQTSSKSAVETTNLTTSFGWQGSDAWQQHDIQELCRVMFDALEQKFKNTKQANLINDLYEGKMLDYVRCLECSTEKSREDTFLDIPLPVRPYGSHVAYNSVEEALRAFVQPEILDGNNQYHCEKCNKKCDAHKGLKFIKFPYLLTLHLKRFDFDYNTLHRIKLNDKVVFSEILNLNSFIQSSDTSESEEQLEEKEMTKYDIDCCTTDSGSALEDESCQSTDASSAINGHDVNCSESDEGIDVSSGNNHKVEDKGPYTYDLFSILIHSGSATGGHYYAYIKDFDKQNWYCFNDQSVSRITEDDIRKTYGGASHRGYYSGAFSSSTNAYMLMYRQIDKERNSKAMSVEEFPVHIRNLLKQMREKEENDRKIKEKENELVKINVFCFHPVTRRLCDIKASVFIDNTLEEAKVCAVYSKFSLQGVVDKENCRLVKFNKLRNCIDCSFASEKIKFCDISSEFNISLSDWFLEIRPPNSEWQVYKAGGVNVTVYPIIMQLEELLEPFIIRVNPKETVGELKQRFCLLLNWPRDTVQVVEEKYSDPIYYERDDEIFNDEYNSFEKLLYIAHFEDDDPDICSQRFRLKRVIEKFRNVITIKVYLPDVNERILEMLSIPHFDPNQNLEISDMSISDRNSSNQTLERLDISTQDTSSPNLSVSPQQATTGICCDGFGDQSNSEDSSLSDSDRTLVGDAPGDGMGISSNSSNSPADQHMVSPSDPTEDSYNYDVLGNPAEDMFWDDNEPEEEQRINSFYFKVLKIDSEVPTEVCPYSRYCKVLVDKRITLDRLKKHLEPYVEVPVEYFKIYRQYPTSSNTPEDEWLNLNDTLKCMNDGDTLIAKLGRVLRKNEYNVKVYMLRPNFPEPISVLLEHIITKGQTVSQVKKDIILQAKKRCFLDLCDQKYRLREKSGKKAKRVYLENEVFDQDILLIGSVPEIFIQELEDVERVNSVNQTAFFVRRWRPSVLQLDPVQEVIMNTSELEELKVAMAQLSGIPIENCELALVKTNIPGDIHRLDINELDWKVTATCFDDSPLYASNGSIFYYRDNREPLKELTPEEKKEINLQENKRLGLSNNIKTYSPGKERALKIYLDMSPCKKNDNYTD